ncbi:SDR family NAD(P)-dependent oxidoreductase [Mycolicibacterium elephantis]
MNNSCACHNVSERVVLITGGSRGLGRHMAFAMAAHGAHVIIASRDEASCSATAAEIERATGRAVMPYGAHVGRWDQIEGLVEAAYAQFGRVDVLINNAGMSPTYASLPEVTEKLFDAVLNVNLKGPFRLAALVGQRMVREGRGSIINVSSTASIRPRPDVVPYAAAKAGLNAMTEALALAYGPTVRVNTLMAGPFAPMRPRNGIQRLLQSWSPAIPCDVSATPTRWSVRLCSWRRRHPVTPPARLCGPTVESPNR